MTSAAPPHRRWFRFSLGNLLLLVALCATLLGWFVDHHWQVQERSRIRDLLLEEVGRRDGAEMKMRVLDYLRRHPEDKRELPQGYVPEAPRIE
jgi:Tfp pilus assembly protein PilN